MCVYLCPLHIRYLVLGMGRDERCKEKKERTIATIEDSTMGTTYLARTHKKFERRGDWLLVLCGKVKIDRTTATSISIHSSINEIANTNRQKIVSQLAQGRIMKGCSSDISHLDAHHPHNKRRDQLNKSEPSLNDHIQGNCDSTTEEPQAMIKNRQHG